MAENVGDDLEFDLLARVSGIPPKGKWGASKSEMIALLVGVVIVLLMVLAFWWEAAGG